MIIFFYLLNAFTSYERLALDITSVPIQYSAGWAGAFGLWPSVESVQMKVACRLALIHVTV